MNTGHWVWYSWLRDKVQCISQSNSCCPSKIICASSLFLQSNATRTVWYLYPHWIAFQEKNPKFQKQQACIRKLIAKLSSFCPRGRHYFYYPGGQIKVPSSLEKVPIFSCPVLFSVQTFLQRECRTKLPMLLLRRCAEIRETHEEISPKMR